MKAKKITLILSSMIIIAILILTACDKRVIELPDYIIQSISAFPDSLYADNDNTTKSEIRATVVDNAGNPVVGETVTFKTLEDSLANINATAVTQSNGVAKVEFLDRGIVGVSTVQATIANSSETVSVRIIEKPAALKKYIAQLFAVPDSIYADNNDATYSEIKAYIVDENGFSVIGDTVYFQTDSDLGSIVSSATTDQNGIATANFHDHGELGTATIQASIPDTIVTVNVRIIETPSCHIDLLLAIPDSIYADDNDATYSEIEAYIVDDNGYPVESYSVSFQTDLGSVDGTAVTDITGIATAKYYDNGNLGIATIQASIEDTTTSIQVRVIELPSYHIEWIDADPDTIYADNNITYSEISVLVKDEQNFAVPGESVSFRTDIGNIITNVFTDSSGIAQTTFWDSGEEGVALIEAFVGDVSSSVQVWIDAVPEIDPDEFILEINSNDINIDEIMTIRARVKNTLGEYVPDGTVVVFETTKGFFQTFDGVDMGILVQQITTNGVAQTYFNAGTQADVATISASISEFVVSEDVTIHPGAPMFMYLRSLNNEGEEQYFIPVNSDENLTIEADVQDKYHNSVESEELVSFETTLGTIQPPLSPTNNEGMAFTTFSPGISAGIAEITAVSDSAQALTVITVTSDDVSSLQFQETDTVNLQVQGTGGMESFELIVNLFDMNGNMIDEDKTVFFQLLTAPAGTNINGEGFADSTQSVNGQAVVAINSGTASGIVEVKAYTYNNEGIEISATKSNIVVNSGPPTTIDFSIGGHDSSVDGQGGMGGGVWRVQVGAFLTDIWGNPVIRGTAVWFSLPDDPGFASIEAGSYVGNENSEGDSLDGMAYTLMSYEGIHTNETVLVRAETGGSFFDEADLVLPIQFPWIDIAAIPQHVDWTEDNNPEWQHSDEELSPKVIVVVKDGQNNPIDGTTVTFMSTLGTLMDPDLLAMDPSHPSFYEDFFDVTGPENDGTLPGEIIKNIRFYQYECPPPNPDGSPGTNTGTVTANIVGTQTTNNVTVILHRYVP